MAKYRLKEGQHIQDDLSQKPRKVKDPATGETADKYPEKTFRKGEIVESATDLEARFGAEKFEYISGDRGKSVADPHAGNRTPGDPTPENALHSMAVAPGGQVSTGFQQTSGYGKSGPMSAEDAAAQGEASAKDAREAEEASAREANDPAQRATVHHGRGHPKK